MKYRNVNYCVTVIVILAVTVDIMAVMLSPTEIAPVCSGDKLELICATTGRVLDWRITAENRILARHPVDSVSQVFPTRVVTISSAMVMFSFSRISLPNSQPLKSKLLISPANVSINGVMINCSDRETGTTSSSTRLRVYECKLYSSMIVIVRQYNSINFRYIVDHLQQAQLSITSNLEKFESDGATVLLIFWNPLLNGTLFSLYQIRPNPQLAMEFTERSSVRIKVLYNTLYNLSIVGPCKENHDHVVDSIVFYYGKFPSLLIKLL